jgi:hypothetical protein
MEIKQQKSSDVLWTNEDGQQIPYNRTTKLERQSEIQSAKIAKKALDINQSLTQFKEFISETAEHIYQLFLEENNGKAPGKGRGGITVYNFDRSIKIQLKVQDSISFDEMTIKEAKVLLDEVLEDGMQGAKDFVKPLVMDAFSTTNGNLDVKRVLGLRRYESKVKDERYTAAMTLISKAIRKPKSKDYYTVWIKNEEGEYEIVQLNFSNI